MNRLYAASLLFEAEDFKVPLRAAEALRAPLAVAGRLVRLLLAPRRAAAVFRASLAFAGVLEPRLGRPRPCGLRPLPRTVPDARLSAARLVRPTLPDLRPVRPYRADLAIVIPYFPNGRPPVWALPRFVERSIAALSAALRPIAYLLASDMES